MAAINRVPKGFLSALDAKTGGITPRESAGVLSPTFDLTDFYLADLTLSGAGGSGTIVAAATQSFVPLIEVPAGEIWLMKFGALGMINLNAAASTAWFLTMALQQAQNSFGVQRIGPMTPQGPFAGIALGNGVTTSTQWDKPFFLKSGAVIGVWVDGVAGGAGVLANVEVSFYRLEV